MTQLGSYPSHRYSKSWITQRLFNNGVPEWAKVRESSISLGQQLLNPISLDIQDTYQQLALERYNSFLSTADISQLDALYRVDLLPEMEFDYTELSNGDRNYIPPSVYGTLDGTEYELTQAEDNDIKTLSLDNLPSRIEDANTSAPYSAVIPETVISNIGSVSPASIYIPGYLYVTLKGNTSWEERTNTTIYYSKIHITGVSRKGTSITEVVPLRYNGTFKTINEWQEVDSILVSYVDSAATICIETFPHNRVSYLDTQNIFVPPSGGERQQFTKIGTRTFGSTFIAESFTLANMNSVRLGINDKEPNYELELLDTNGNNVTILDFAYRPNTRFIYAISTTKFYVYDVNLPFPDVSDFTGESQDAKVDLGSDKWILTRDETATIYTHNLDISNVPWRVRWSLLDPNDSEYYLGLDGSLWPTTTDAWIDNEKWDDQLWDEQQIDISLTYAGRYIISLEAQYFNGLTNTTTTLTTKFMFFVPTIEAEVEFTLPVALQSSTNIGLDSDNNIWLVEDESINKLNIFFDYFIVDYERKRIYLKEDYSSVRIDI